MKIPLVSPKFCNFNSSQVVPTLYEFISFVEHRIIILKNVEETRRRNPTVDGISLIDLHSCLRKRILWGKGN